MHESTIKISVSPNLLILPKIEMEKLLNTQKWDTKYLLPKFTKKVLTILQKEL